jgi:hypothetical protein
MAACIPYAMQLIGCVPRLRLACDIPRRHDDITSAPYIDAMYRGCRHVKNGFQELPSVAEYIDWLTSIHYMLQYIKILQYILIYLIHTDVLPYTLHIVIYYTIESDSPHMGTYILPHIVAAYQRKRLPWPQ